MRELVAQEFLLLFKALQVSLYPEKVPTLSFQAVYYLFSPFLSFLTSRKSLRVIQFKFEGQKLYRQKK